METGGYKSILTILNTTGLPGSVQIHFQPIDDEQCEGVPDLLFENSDLYNVNSTNNFVWVPRPGLDVIPASGFKTCICSRIGPILLGQCPGPTIGQEVLIWQCTDMVSLIAPMCAELYAYQTLLIPTDPPTTEVIPGYFEKGWREIANLTQMYRPDLMYYHFTSRDANEAPDGSVTYGGSDSPDPTFCNLPIVQKHIFWGREMDGGYSAYIEVEVTYHTGEGYVSARYKSIYSTHNHTVVNDEVILNYVLESVDFDTKMRVFTFFSKWWISEYGFPTLSPPPSEEYKPAMRFIWESAPAKFYMVPAS